MNMQIKAIITGIPLFGPSSLTISDTRTALVSNPRFSGIFGFDTSITKMLKLKNLHTHEVCKLGAKTSMFKIKIFSYTPLDPYGYHHYVIGTTRFCSSYIFQVC